MDWSQLQWIATGVASVIMYLWKRNADAQSKEITELQIAVQLLKDTRLHKDDFKDFKMELRTQFQDLKEAIKSLSANGS